MASSELGAGSAGAGCGVADGGAATGGAGRGVVTGGGGGVYATWARWLHPARQSKAAQQASDETVYRGVLRIKLAARLMLFALTRVRSILSRGGGPVEMFGDLRQLVGGNA